LSRWMIAGFAKMVEIGAVAIAAKQEIRAVRDV
jgi:hypothetical protein